MYLTKSTFCIHGMLPEIQLLATRYHDFIQNKLSKIIHSFLFYVVKVSQNGRRNIDGKDYNII